LHDSFEKNHAFLVLAHTDFQMLSRLVRRMSKIGPVYIHIDLKTDISSWPLQQIASTCEILPNRVPVFWGDWSQVEATTRLIEAALLNVKVTRLTLISGSHYPLLSNNQIEAEAKKVNNVIAARPAPNQPDGSRPEIEYSRRYYRSRRPNGLSAILKNAFMNHIIFRHRSLDWESVTPPTGMRAGSPYWSVQRDLAEYLVHEIRSNRSLISYFTKIVCPDEKVFATLSAEYDFLSEMKEGTTFAKWKRRQNPEPLTKADIENAIKEHKFWFARKFGSGSQILLDWLDDFATYS
jgi:hypothetical protein